MSIRIGGAANADEPEVMVEMNTTPLIDVMLVLLVMLIITIPIQLHSIDMNMPIGVPPPRSTVPEVIKLDITADNRILWNGEWLQTQELMLERMKAAVAQSVQPEIHLRPDRLAKYDTVANVLANSQRLGLVKIGLVGSEQYAR